jgi:hypothetical protein
MPALTKPCNSRRAHRIALATALSLCVCGALAAPPVAGPPLLGEVAAAVDPAQLQATLTHLVAFGTRHTLSDTLSQTRGIGAARRWVQGRFAALSADCGHCLEVITPSQTVTGPRIPKPTEVMDIVAIQRGSSDPDRVILITGHLDSRVSDIMNATSDAPGANDDGSGVAAVLEAARVLSKHPFRATLVYAALSGEEQGLYGGKLLAAYARDHGWQVEADLNNDIIGNSHGADGVTDNTTVRVFSEGTKALETPAQAARRRYNGGEVDSPSRNLARFMADLADRTLTNLRVEMVYRTDRYGRGGDQVAFLDQGFPAVRVTEAHEDYTHQHQDTRTENDVHYGDTLAFVDIGYLAQVTRLNLVTLAALAQAPAPPTGVTIAGAVTPDTTLAWRAAAGAAGYRVWWRDTTAARWQYHRDVLPGDTAGATDSLQTTLKNVVIDNGFFGVASVSADGFESPTVFPGDPGAF